MGPTQLPVERELPPRYAVTIGGALVGGIAGGALALAVSVAYVGGLDDITDGAFVVLGLVFLLLGTGTTGGVGLALKAVRDRVAGRTSVMTAFGFLAWSVVSMPSLFWVAENAPERGRAKIAVLLAVAAMLAAPPAVGARWIILANERLANREESSG
ncbi:MAG TPA: hypothetical protein VJ927_08880 [Actinomycetota bacterium]|nr:hypothetical protein [Actinomycetota bacterium]